MDVDAEIQQNNPSKAPVPHDVLWFPDGNVVLATDKYLFKVYKGLLSMNSSFFRDMFELPHVGRGGSIAEQDGNGNGGGGTIPELYEGLPLVTMVGDDGEEVAHLLRAIYERNFYERLSSNTPLNAIVALLKLSTKYDFKSIRKDVIIQVSKHYPISLQERDELGEKDLPVFQVGRLDCDLPLLVAAFAAGVDVLMPVLYAACAGLTMDSILDHFDTEETSFECLAILLKGRERFDLEVSEFLADLPYDLSPEGVNIPGCLKSQQCFINARYKRLSTVIGSTFHTTRGRHVVQLVLSPVCTKCSSSVATSIDSKREEIWAKVPSYFGCPEWGVVREKLKEIEDS